MRAICTSASLQASTWVSPGFTLFRHSSPPFGSKQAHSNATHGGPVGVGHSCCVHTIDKKGCSLHLPFSTREVLATISPPLRVCLTPWSVFQDGWGHPISFANIEHHGEESAARVQEREIALPRPHVPHPLLGSAHFTKDPNRALLLRDPAGA